MTLEAEEFIPPLPFTRAARGLFQGADPLIECESKGTARRAYKLQFP